MSLFRVIKPFVKSYGDRILLKNVTVNNPTISRRLEVGSIIIRPYSPPKKAVVTAVVLKNKDIRFPTMRVVYDDEITGKSTHKIFLRSEALEFAQSRKLDLVLGNNFSFMFILF